MASVLRPASLGDGFLSWQSPVGGSFDIGGFLSNIYAGKMMMEAIGTAQKTGGLEALGFGAMGGGFLEGLAVGMALGKEGIAEAAAAKPTAGAGKSKAAMFAGIEKQIGPTRELTVSERTFMRERAAFRDMTVEDWWTKVKEEEGLATAEEAETWLAAEVEAYETGLITTITEMFGETLTTEQLRNLMQAAENMEMSPLQYASSRPPSQWYLG